MNRIPTIQEIQSMPPEQIRAVNRELGRRLALRIAGFAAIKFAIMYGTHRLVKHYWT